MVLALQIFKDSMVHDVLSNHRTHAEEKAVMPFVLVSSILLGTILELHFLG